jgi:hypothetical protein
MTIFEEIKYSLIGQKPVTYKYFADGRRVLVEEDENVRWFVRLLVRLIVLLLFLSLLRLFGFIPNDWQTVSNVTGLSRAGSSDGNAGANDANGSASGSGAGTLNGSTGGDGGLVFGSGNTSTDGQPGSAIVDGGTITGGNGVIGADGAPGPAGPAGPAGQDGAPGPAGANGADGLNGLDGVSGISNGQGSAAIGACDQNVKVELKSYWDFASFTFKLDQIQIKNVSNACSNQTLTLILLKSSTSTVLSTISFNTGQITSPEGTLNINRGQIGTVISNQVSDVAFEIAG